MILLQLWFRKSTTESKRKALPGLCWDTLGGIGVCCLPQWDPQLSPGGKAVLFLERMVFLPNVIFPKHNTIPHKLFFQLTKVWVPNTNAA